LLFGREHGNLNTWHFVVKMRKVEVLVKKWELGKEDVTKEEVNKLLLVTGNEGRTVFHEAARFNKVEGIQGILSCAKEYQQKSR
jgi:hypothetical protein